MTGVLFLIESLISGIFFRACPFYTLFRLLGILLLNEDDKQLMNAVFRNVACRFVCDSLVTECAHVEVIKINKLV